MDRRFLVFITLLILLSSSGIGITAAESSGGNSTNTNSVSSELTDDNSISHDTFVNDASTDNNSVNDTYTDDNSVDNNSVNDAFTDNNSAYDTSIDNNSTDYASVDNNSINDISTENNLTNESELISSEPQTNIQYTETTQVYINKEQNVNINITNYNSVVNNINFDTKKSLGKTTIIVEDLKEKSHLINNPPAGNIYKSFNIWIDNKDVNYIENAVINFQVEKSWLKENNLNSSAIVLNVYSNGKWIEVPVTITRQNTKYVYFTAKVSGYSSFTITGKTDKTSVATEQKTNNSSISQDEIISLLKEIINRLDEIIKLLK